MLSIILLRCGDVHPNPGPPFTGSDSSEHNTSVSSTYSASLNGASLLNYELIKDKFYVIHYNVQSLQHKVPTLESELSSFQIMCFTETWLNHTITDEDIKNLIINPLLDETDRVTAMTEYACM